MWIFIGTSIALAFGLATMSALMRREEIKANWSQYKSDPMFMFTAFLFKPDDDPRSRIKFSTDNFYEVINDVLNKVFSVFLGPVFNVFNIFSDALKQSLSGLFNIRSLLGNLWNRWREMSDVFFRRFNTVFHQLRMTFIKLFNAMHKSYGVAVSSLFAGLSTVSTMLSFVDLMIKIAIVFLVIMVIMMIFLFFVLWPVIPMIVAVVALIAVSTFGGAVGGMSSTFCFAENTPIATENGPVPIFEVEIGTKLVTGGLVEGVMQFDQIADDLYTLNGVVASASHIVYMDGDPIHVSDHPLSAKYNGPEISRLYCLITSDRKIPVHSSEGITMFADWEELQQDEKDLKEWYAVVYEILNGYRPTVEPSSDALNSEAVLSGKTHIWTPVGLAEIRGIHPGDKVLDADNKPVRVTGVVKVSGYVVKASRMIGNTAAISAGAWWNADSVIDSNWSQPTNTVLNKDFGTWYSLITESGTFKICEPLAIGVVVRDFTDVGAEAISKTYDMVIDTLSAAVENT